MTNVDQLTFEELQAEHEKLVKKYAKLEGNYKSLKREYNRLVDFYGEESKRHKESKKAKREKKALSEMNPSMTVSLETGMANLKGKEESEEEVETPQTPSKRFSLSNPSGEYPEFSEEQVSIAKHAFKKYDWDNDGSIDRAEVILLLQDLKQEGYIKISESLFRRYVDMQWRKIDADSSGNVSLEEFLVFLFKSTDLLNTQVTQGIKQKVRASVSYQKGLQQKLDAMQKTEGSF